MRTSLLIAALLAGVAIATPALAQTTELEVNRTEQRMERADRVRAPRSEGLRGGWEARAAMPAAPAGEAPRRGGFERQRGPDGNVSERRDRPARIEPGREGGWLRRTAPPAVETAPAAPPVPQATPQRRDWRGVPPGSRDRDGDGIVNRRDRDRNGDGIRDIRRDRDRDGMPNWRDRDRDGDGIANRRDWDRNNDGRVDGRWDRNRNGIVDRRYDWNRDGRRDDGRWTGGGRSTYNIWNRDWRSDRRYDWQGWRYQNRNLYRLPRYSAPYGHGYGYRRFNVGIYLDGLFFASRYWLDDPWRYRLPDAQWPFRWVRYYDDVLLVDTRNGFVVDVIHGFFW